MHPKNTPSTEELKKTLDLYLSNWKLILFCIILTIGLAFVFLRYTTYQYEASATIKIKDEKQSQKLPSMAELTKGGLFAEGSNKIKDEIAVMTSRSIISNIVKNLHLNIRYYEQGKIKEQELYKNPPLKLNFFVSDSIIHQVDTTLFIKVKSSSEFLMFTDNGKSIIDRSDSDGTLYAFGDRIKTRFGDMIIIPNIGNHSPKIGSNLKVSINPINFMVDLYKPKIKTSMEDGLSIVQLQLKDNIPERAVDF
ncbi:MAG TPA: Wzz/FepE/Etk N-terminal domain-containing protein, partial [Gelidibacter sp.]|uniref:Wzz/FepE/Etk N-terminal domain-containing protein n=1 Tax=Gelidibacter sp. TaxID=2018083 RepID=UPI002C718213